MFRLLTQAATKQSSNQHRLVIAVRRFSSKAGGDNNTRVPDMLAKKEAQQQEFLKRKQQDSKVGVDMPPDLLEFIKGNPVREVPTDQLITAPPRVPKYLRDDEGEEEEEEEEETGDENFELGADGRRVEDMPLVEKLPEFSTKRTTNFSRRKDRVSTKIFKSGDVLDIYDMLMRKKEHQVDTENALDDEALAEQIYAEYGQKHELPDNKYQEGHKQMIFNTLKYLTQPVLLRDDEGEFDGARPEDVESAVQFFKYTEVPNTRAQFVMKDLSDRRRRGD